MSVETFIAGGGQHTWRDGAAPDPAEAMATACRLALADAGAPVDSVDLISCVEPLSWTYSNLGEVVAGKLGLKGSVAHLWVPAGGTSPQDLLHQIGGRIAAGELHCALICGAESMRTRRRLSKAPAGPDWPPRSTDVNPMRGQAPFTSALEHHHGLRAPVQVFPLLENAIRAACGRSEQAQTAVAAGLLARNASVATNNPYAWFRDAPSAEAIGAVTADNRMIAFPYTKRMNAIMDVDQCAAVLVVSRRWLEKNGASAEAAAVLGGAGAEETWNPIQRPTFATCPAMHQALTVALDRAGVEARDIDAMDLYSCFPSAIQLGLAALGTSVEDKRPVSLTGGLAFAGGPGNAYVLHSLATALTRIRQQPDSRVLVTGIGMANTKHTATVLSSGNNVPPAATGKTTYREEFAAKARAVDDKPKGSATITTYTIEYDRAGQPVNVIVILDLEDNTRTIANMADPVRGAEALRMREPIGLRGMVVHDPALDRNLFELQR